MPYQFIQWGKNSSINGDRLKAMVDNDNYLYDRAKTIPQGVIYYARKSAIQTITTSDPSKGKVTELDGTFHLQGVRLLKISLFGATLYNSVSGDGASEYHINLNGSYKVPSGAVGESGASQYRSNAGGIGSYVTYVLGKDGLNAIEVTYSFPNFQTASIGTPSTYEQQIGANMTLIVEDLGEP